MANDLSEAAFQARVLARGARMASLATVTDGGQPFATLVTPACDADFSFLLLLSDLSEHTRHLRAEPRCALLFTGAQEGENPQTAPRVTVTGIAAIAPIADDTALKARYLTVHPYAALYAGFGDFHIWRIRSLGALFVGGFARALRPRVADLIPSPAAAAALAAEAADIIHRHEMDYPASPARLAGEAGGWRIAAIDTDGADLAWGDKVKRIAWSAPVMNAAGARAELARLTREAGV